MNYGLSPKELDRMATLPAYFEGAGAGNVHPGISMNGSVDAGIRVT